MRRRRGGGREVRAAAGRVRRAGAGGVDAVIFDGGYGVDYVENAGEIMAGNATPVQLGDRALGGMRVEFIIHTNRSWLNYMYQRDVSHDEYEVRRIFDSGVAELLFPSDIFHLDHEAIRDDMIRLFRRQIER